MLIKTEYTEIQVVRNFILALTLSVLSRLSGKNNNILIISSEEEVGTTVEPTYVTLFFLVSCNFFLSVLNGSWLQHD